MPTTNVPAITFTSTGPVAPQPAAVLAGRMEDINQAFGGNVNPNPNTPQGQLVSSETAAIVEKNNEVLYEFQQFDPQYASGRSQDALGRIYFLDRHPAVSTTVICQLTGTPNLVIPANSLAVDTSGNTYYAVSAYTLDANGLGSGTWANVVTGPIACPAGTLTRIKSVVAGWLTITNAATGVLGNDVETQSEFEYRRQQSVAANSHGTNNAMRGAILKMTGVTDCYVVDNPRGVQHAQGATNYLLAPNSIYIGVVGTATDEDIANTIYTKKDSGCAMNGNTTIQVEDPSGYSYPIPSYPITFNRVTDIDTYFVVNIVNNGNVPTNIQSIIATAIQNQFTGGSTQPMEQIGATIFALNYSATILASNPNVELLDVYVGFAANPTNTQQPVGIDQMPTLNTANVTVVLV